MSGDVQPRKRKDKKKKKDELGVEEPRGTAAVLGEGDVFLHSHQDHGTGGHWCAKIIFFSLLAVLITLVGLIILENRGLSELEANAVESRYSGVLEGWLEDATDDDHHDAHTLELKHHDDNDAHGNDDEEHQTDQDDDDDHDGDDDHDEDGELDDYDHEEDDEDTDHEDEEHANDDRYEDEEDQEDEEGDDPEGDDEDERDQENEGQIDDAADEEDEDVGSFRKYFGFGYGDEDEADDENTESKALHEEKRDEYDDVENESNLSNEISNDGVENEGFRDERKIYDVDNDASEENEDNDGLLNEGEDLNTENNKDNSFENFDNDDDDTLNDYNEKEEDDDHDEDDDDDGEEDTEVERIEREVSQEDPISMQLSALPEDDDDKDQDQEDDDDEKPGDDSDEDVDNDPDTGEQDDDFLEADEEIPIERISAPSGRPFDELEDEEFSTEKPPDTLEEEEKYEKKQEELRREQEQSSHMWLKLVVGAALLAATHAVMRRATAPSDETESEEHVSREETPVVDRRMTLIPVPEEPSEPGITQKTSKSKPVEKIVKKTSTVVKYAPPPKEESDEENEEAEEIEMDEQEKNEEKELFSEEETEDDPEQEDEIMLATKQIPKQAVPTVHEPTPDDEVGDDVEIIDDDQLEEELEDEEDDEEISDVDDAELLTRLEAKYGRLPEPDRPGPKHKDGGNSIEEEWPGEPSDPYWRQQVDSAEQHLRQGEYAATTRLASAPQLTESARARWLLARALDVEAEARRDNRILTRAIAAYINLLKMNERLSDKKLLEIANRTLERIQFRGNYLSAEPVYRLLIRRFPDDVTYRNKLTVSYLMANRPDLADEVLKETLRLWPSDRVALAHYGFVLKTQHNKFEEAVVAFQKALEGDQGPACEPRFYYHLGDALLLLGRFPEAHEVHKRGAKLGHFLSPAQRSLYNVPRLKSKPWWNVEDTPYVKLARLLENSWREILKEGLAAQALYEKEKEGLKERGEWSQLDLFVRGQEIPGRCKQAPVTCSVVKTEMAAAGCRRGQIKFSAMEPGTHVRPHVGPTNCRLRMHLGLSNTKDTYLRVDRETRQWQEGKVLLFDDSFEHEVWHNGTGKRLVLIMDVWHPDLTPAERRQLPAI